MPDNEPHRLDRRQVLRAIGAGTAIGVGGLGTFTGTAAAWDRKDVDFKGCSEVWFVVGDDDVRHDPPSVVRVVVALPDGTTECRDVELTPENTTWIPGQYGDAPVRKVSVDDGEKVLGVIYYNYRSEDRFSAPSCIHTNDHRCASTPGTPSLEDAACVQTARANDGYDCSNTESDRNGNRGRADDDSSVEGNDESSGEGNDERPGEGNSRGRDNGAGPGRGRGFDRAGFGLRVRDLFSRLFGL